MKKAFFQQQPNTIPWTASTQAQLVLNNLSFRPTGFLLEIEVAKTDGGSPTTYTDYLSRVATSLLIQGAGNTYLSCTGLDLRPLTWAMRGRLNYAYYRPVDMVAGTVAATSPLRLTIPILFSPNPLRPDGRINWEDDTVSIPNSSDLTITVAWGAATALGANRTISSALMRVTPFGVTGGRTGGKTPQWATITDAPSQSYNNESRSIVLPGGFYYRRSHFLFLLGASPADNRNDGLNGVAVSEINFTNYTGEKLLDEKVWTFAQQSQGNLPVQDDNSAVAGATVAGGVSVMGGGWNSGVGMLDYVRRLDTSTPVMVNGRNIGPDPVYGLNLIAKDYGAAKFGLTVDTATNQKTVLFNEAYLDQAA